MPRASAKPQPRFVVRRETAHPYRYTAPWGVYDGRDSVVARYQTEETAHMIRDVMERGSAD